MFYIEIYVQYMNRKCFQKVKVKLKLNWISKPFVKLQVRICLHILKILIRTITWIIQFLPRRNWASIWTFAIFYASSSRNQLFLALLDLSLSQCPLDLKGVCKACSRYLSTNVYCASQLNDDICDTRLEALEMGVTIETWDGTGKADSRRGMRKIKTEAKSA